MQTGHITYPLGATVTIPRALVDDNRDAACSVGLHVGTFSYASSFAPRTLLVLVDPADVVSVPRHSDGQKMRVSRFVVAAEHDGSQVQEAVITIADPSARTEYQSRPENAIGSDTEKTDSKPDSKSDRKRKHASRKRRSSQYIPRDNEGRGRRGKSRRPSRKPRDTKPATPVVDEVVADVAANIYSKISVSPLTNRELGKRFSKGRRVHVAAALEYLLSSKKIVLNEDKRYTLA